MTRSHHSELNRSPLQILLAGARSPVLLLCLLVAPPVFVQHVFAQNAAPSTEQMINQLKPAGTRSLRNLTVEAAAVAAPEKTAAGLAGTGAALPSASEQAQPTPVGASSLTLLIQFDFDSARVRAESRQALVNLSQALQSKELAVSRFAVEGHTDAKGALDYNQKLSQTRALAVRDFLTAQGVAPERLVAAGKGSSELVNSAAPYSAQNRRVRIVNLD